MKRVIAILVLGVLFGAGNAWAATPSFQGLGHLSTTVSNINSSALGISSDGSVVTGEGISNSGWEAFRWTSAGGMVGLGDLPGGASQAELLLFRLMDKL